MKYLWLLITLFLIGCDPYLKPQVERIDTIYIQDNKLCFDFINGYTIQLNEGNTYKTYLILRDYYGDREEDDKKEKEEKKRLKEIPGQ